MQREQDLIVEYVFVLLLVTVWRKTAGLLEFMLIKTTFQEFLEKISLTCTDVAVCYSSCRSKEVRFAFPPLIIRMIRMLLGAMEGMGFEFSEYLYLKKKRNHL